MQLPREPLLTAETQHLLGEHRDAFQLMGTAGHQEQEGSFMEGRLRACLILGLHKMSPSPQGLASCFHLLQHLLTCHLPRAAEMDLCISCYSPAVWHLCFCYHWICSCQTANHETHCTHMCPGLPRLPAEQQPLALGREDKTAGMSLHSHALFSVKLQAYRAASHKEDTAQDLSR